MKRVGFIRDCFHTVRYRLLERLVRAELRMRADHWAWRCQNPKLKDKTAKLMRELAHLGPLMAKRSLATDLDLKDIWS